jgi:predicted secreted Zn-dependent protease
MKQLLLIALGLGLFFGLNRQLKEIRSFVNSVQIPNAKSEKPVNSDSNLIRSTKNEIEKTEAPSTQDPLLIEVEGLQREVAEIYNRTQFDYHKMTEKEFEDAVKLLEIYNLKIKQLVEVTNSGEHS